jgi:hypothetical protein
MGLIPLMELSLRSRRKSHAARDAVLAQLDVANALVDAVKDSSITCFTSMYSILVNVTNGKIRETNNPEIRNHLDCL